MRVIAGTAHGTPLATLPGEDVTRPTIARVKESMFSALQFQLPGAKVLDLFAKTKTNTEFVQTVRKMRYL